MTTQWVPPPRPEWLAAFLDSTREWDAKAVAPLDPDELIATAVARTGLSDFGADDWREPFERLMKAIDEEAELHLYGRLWTRADTLQFLENRLLIEDAYARHPEIEDEVIDKPVFITGTPRSGTSILFELLAQDEQFLAAANWEFVLPCPPPEAATYRNDSRVPKAEHLIQQMGRVAPTYRTMHEMGAWIPNECGVAFQMAFRSHHQAGVFQVPSYTNWLIGADLTPAYRLYKRILKLLQWRNPRTRWLLKSPEHQTNLPVLFKVFPDAQVIMTHRDPVKAQASVTNLMGTLYWMRSNKVFDATAFEQVLSPEGTAARFDLVIDWIEAGTIPRDQIFNSLYADLIEAPVATLEGLYIRMGLPFTRQAREAVGAYLATKPKHKFGAHRYEVSTSDEAHAPFRRYQQYFKVPREG